MHTRCPHCDTRYEIDETSLEVTDGLARCHRCHGIFNAYEEFQPKAAPAATPASPPLEEPPPLDLRRLAKELHSEPPHSAAVANAAPIPRPPPLPPKVVAPADETTLSDEDLTELMGAERPGGPGWRIALGLLVITLLTGITLAQWGWYERHWLLAQPQLRTYLGAACEHIGCELPSMRAPEQFEVIHRDLAPSDVHPGALALRARLRNNADHAQPAPQLQLALYDNQHRLVARRRFEPLQYLAEDQTGSPVRPGESLQIELLIEDPGAHATGFELAFH